MFLVLQAPMKCSPSTELKMERSCYLRRYVYTSVSYSFNIRIEIITNQIDFYFLELQSQI